MKIKKKLKDVTINEYENWYTKNCSSYDKCDTCLFKSVNCFLNDKDNWVSNKESFSNKFLNQEINIEKCDILTEKEKKYLRNIIRPFRKNVDYIHKELGSYKYEYIFIEINCHSMEKNYHTICLPPFPRNSMYKNMENACDYTLAQLKL